MLKLVFDSLESPHHPLLGPNIKSLQNAGMLQYPSGIKKHFHNCIHLIGHLFILTQFIELWIIRSDLDSALRNLSISMLSLICIIKAATFISWGNHWKDIIQAVSDLEVKQLNMKDAKTTSIIHEYIKYSRQVTLFYWSLIVGTVLAVDLAPLALYMSNSDYRQKISEGLEPYPEILSSWLPFDKSQFKGYCIFICEQMLITCYGGSIVAGYDTTAVSLMAFFAGQLKLLKMNCERIFGDEKVLTDDEAIQKIKECHEHHVFLVKYMTELDSLMSPVKFVYVIICSLMICASAVQMTNEGTTRMQQIWIAEYLVALVSQLFLYCWHSNEVLVMSREVEDGVYFSAWWTRNTRLRKSILLLSGQLRKTMVFNAGPFTTLSVTALVAILKGSYSYFTLLSNNAD